MPVPADLILLHHQGAGAPNDAFHFLDQAKYSGGVGVQFRRLVRPPWESFITTGRGGRRALQLCISGNRDVYDLTDRDIVHLAALAKQARDLGWVRHDAAIGDHNDSTSTSCPGDKVEAREPAAYAAIRAAINPTQEPPEMAGKQWILVPDKLLPNGPFKGKRPKVQGEEGSVVLRHLSEEQVERLRPALGDEVVLPVSLWLTDGIDAHIYIENDAIL